MAERRTTTLLDFAIAASAAVVPVLLLVLLVVGVLRPLDPAFQGARNGDRHVSVRQVAALKTFERAIVRRDTVAVGPPTALQLLDGVPQCRAAWDGHLGLLDRVRAALARSGMAPPTFVTGPRAPEAELCARPEMFALAEDRGRATPPTGIAGEATPDLPVDD